MLAVLAGCGGDGASDEDQVRAVVGRFTTALAGKDDEEACSRMTAAKREDLEFRTWKVSDF